MPVSTRAARLIAANRTPAGHPRSGRAAPTRPAAQIQTLDPHQRRHLGVVNARSAARMSVIRPSRRYRFSSSGGSGPGQQHHPQPAPQRRMTRSSPRPTDGDSENSPQSNTHTTGTR